MGLPDAVSAIEGLDRVPGKIEANGAIGRVVHNHTHGPTKGWQRFMPVLAAELDPLFGEEHIRCVEVADASSDRILPDATIIPFDNRGKKLQRASWKGFVLKRQGKHEVWVRQGFAPSADSRTKEVADGTAK